MLDDLKNQLAVTIKAYQSEGKPVPDQLWEQGIYIFEIENALRENDEVKFEYYMEQLLGGGTLIA
ncbi:hypothetical protein [Pseudomonas sp. JUb52]|uniref:hypothetical protein n=1 Tax=Pseudomonas sp. JUb52 TaxID=2485127 RepID=UPI001051237F|nr:hypothetical protein [Pseudomonas sp. JUb52]TCQ85423.1 hypothetical protein EC839_110153 [Pseudomonas sp. JUb52]